MSALSVFDNLIDQEIIENGRNYEINEQKHENILNIASDLIEKIEKIGFTRFARRLLEDLENMENEDQNSQVYWQDF